MRTCHSPTCTNHLRAGQSQKGDQGLQGPSCPCFQQAKSNKYNNHWCYLHPKLKPGRCKFDDDDDDDGDGDNNVDIDDDDDGRWSEWVTVALF